MESPNHAAAPNRPDQAPYYSNPPEVQVEASTELLRKVGKSLTTIDHLSFVLLHSGIVLAETKADVDVIKRISDIKPGWHVDVKPTTIEIRSYAVNCGLNVLEEPLKAQEVEPVEAQEMQGRE